MDIQWDKILTSTLEWTWTVVIETVDVIDPIMPLIVIVGAVAAGLSLLRWRRA
jgi:hypothetical protein